MIENGIFGNKASFDERFFPDYEKLSETILHLKALGNKIVLTSGSFDLLHIGHTLYVEKAREFGDVIVVGVDSDAKIEKRKGRRPFWDEDTRMRTLVHTRNVDIVTLKTPEMEKWALIKAVKPDFLVRSKGSKGYILDEDKALREFCGEVIVLEPQATNSSSALIRRMYADGAGVLAEKVKARLDELIPGIIEQALQELKEGK